MTTHPSVPALDDPPASPAIQDLQRRYGKDWSIWRSSDGSIYATRHAHLSQAEIDAQTAVADKERRPARTVAADKAPELIELLDAQYEIVAEVAENAGAPNPLA